MIPQSNATLTKVEGGGFSEDFDQPAGADPAKWEGSQPAYFHEETAAVLQRPTGRLASSGEAMVNEIVARWLVVSASLDVDWAIGDTVAFQFAGDTIVREVREIKRSVLPGVTGTVRLILENA